MHPNLPRLSGGLSEVPRLDFAFVTARRRRRICARYIALRTIVAFADDFIGK